MARRKALVLPSRLRLALLALSGLRRRMMMARRMMLLLRKVQKH
jgi:hypothetical protein